MHVSLLKLQTLCFHGKVPLISQPGAHPWHIFLLVLAVFHVLYGVGSMALGQAKTLQDSGLLIKSPLFSAILADLHHLAPDGL
ncbi:hypothetical protein CK203_067078 [Vitis vinifera]|uniref:Uncharacterized protein n=1 Tax=Vitis vinifera TaxID=29760 RepID=A0A438F564_VITVI|nr:hypothetical protein CK203_067078 [Vitis vinifera]